MQFQQISKNVIFKFEENHLFKVDLNIYEKFINNIKEALPKINSLDFEHLTKIKKMNYKNFLIS